MSSIWASCPTIVADAIAEVRDVILANLPAGIVETMRWGMISYEVPLEVFPDTYNKKPLSYAALASQKNHMAVYLHSIYMHEDDADWFATKYKATGKKFDMGKSCGWIQEARSATRGPHRRSNSQGHPQPVPQLLPRVVSASDSPGLWTRTLENRMRSAATIPDYPNSSGSVNQSIE